MKQQKNIMQQAVRLPLALVIVLLVGRDESSSSVVQAFYPGPATVPSTQRNPHHASSADELTTSDETAQERIHRMRSGRLTEEEKRRFLETTLGNRYGDPDTRARQLSPAKPASSILSSSSWKTESVIATRHSNIPSSQLEKDRIKREWVNRILDPDRFAGYAQAKRRTWRESTTTDDDDNATTPSSSKDDITPIVPASIVMGPPGLRSSRTVGRDDADEDMAKTGDVAASSSPPPVQRETSTHSRMERPRPSAAVSSPPVVTPSSVPSPPTEPTPTPVSARDQHRAWMEHNYPPPDPSLSLRDAAAEHAAWMDHKKDDHIHAIDILRRRRQQHVAQPERQQPKEDTTSRRRPDPHPEWSAEEKSKRWGIDLTGLQ